jgi:hypothetical protein
MDKNGQWNVTIHLWFEGKGAKIEWELYDPNKNKAGEYKMDPVNAKDDIHTYIESWHDRAEEMHGSGAQCPSTMLLCNSRSRSQFPIALRQRM